MTAKQTALPFRSDTMLGVCQALGEDFGFHPNILRIAFASASPFLKMISASASPCWRIAAA